MPNLGMPQRLGRLRARVREFLIDVRWYVLITIDRQVRAWLQRNADRE
jgi:hypothetical protein